MYTIFNLPDAENDAIDFFQKKDILLSERICESGHNMQLYTGEKTVWRCK